MCHSLAHSCVHSLSTVLYILHAIYRQKLACLELLKMPEWLYVLLFKFDLFSSICTVNVHLFYLVINVNLFFHHAYLELTGRIHGNGMDGITGKRDVSGQHFRSLK